MIRLPPISTLFPHTTLFHSSRRSGKLPTNTGAPPASVVLLWLCRSHLTGHASPPGDTVTHLPPPDTTRRRVVTNSLPRRDRKSTRLNSSHANISYAVFCLKK